MGTKFSIALTVAVALVFLLVLYLLYLVLHP